MFCAADVCKALGYTNPRKAVADHVDEGDVTKRDTPTSSGTQTISYVNESGLYSLIFGSKLPTAKAFKKWVTSEILPSIRKHGAYATETTIDSIIANPENGIKLLQALQQEREENARLQAKNEQQQSTIELQSKEIQQAAPKVNYYDNHLQSVNTQTSTQVAKQIGMDAEKLHKKLKEKGIIYRQSGQWILHTPYSTWGLHSTRTQTYTRSDGSIGTSVYTVWTAKGVRFIIALYENSWDVKKAVKQIKGELEPAA